MQERTYRGYQHFYSAGPYAKHLVEHRLAGSTPARLLHVAQPAGAFPDPPLPEFLVYVCLGGAKRLAFDWGCGRWAGSWHPADISIAPANTGTDIVIDQPHAFLALALPVNLVTSALDELSPQRPAAFGKLHATTFRDKAVSHLFSRLWDEARDGLTQCSLRTDSLVFALLSALAYRAHDRAETSQRGLDSRRLQHIRDFVEHSLSDNIFLRDLARIANLSPMHFAQQFRAATGMSPHQFVLARRIARARSLLSLTTHSLTDIAAAAGFSSQAHMTSTFTKRLNTTPARFRMERRA